MAGEDDSTFKAANKKARVEKARDKVATRQLKRGPFT